MATPSKAGQSHPTGLARPATFDHLRKKPRPERVVEIYLDPDALRALEEARAALERAKLSNGTDLAPLQDAVRKAEKECEKHTEQLLLRGIGRRRYDELVAKFPPTPEQNKEHKEQYGQNAPYDSDRFPPALISASLVEPALTVEEVAELFDEWNTAEVLRLWTATLEVNTQSDLVSLGKSRQASNGTRS